jgi:hypothetical protein
MPLLFYLNSIKEMMPLLEKLADSNPRLLLNILSIQNKYGMPLLFYLNSIKEMMPLLEKLADSNPRLLLDILSIQDTDGDTFLAYPNSTKEMMPFLKKLVDSHPRLLLDILSIQDKKDRTCFAYSSSLKEMKPLLEKLADSHPRLLLDILSIQDKNGRTFFAYIDSLKEMMPVLEKLADSHPRLLLDFLSIQDKENDTFLTYPEATTLIMPLLKELESHHPEFFLKIEEKLLTGLLDLKYRDLSLYDLLPKINLSKGIREVSKRKLITHIAEIDLLSTLETRGAFQNHPIAKAQFAFTGSHPAFVFKKIDRSLHAFSEQLPEVMPSELANFVLESIDSNKSKEQKGEVLFKLWQAHHPILINAGYLGHYVSILVWENKLIITNRGEGCVDTDGTPHTSLVYTFDPAKFNVEVIDKIQSIEQSGDSQAYLNLVQTELNDLLLLSQSEFDTTMQKQALPIQLIGNCGMANAEGGIKALITLHKLRQINKNVDEVDPAQAKTTFEEVDQLFTNWKASFLIQTLSRYLNWVRNPDNHFIPDIERVELSFLWLDAMGSIDQRLKENYLALREEWNQEIAHHRGQA